MALTGTTKWVCELALAAKCHGLVSPPQGFRAWPAARKAEWSALQICDLKRRASEGERAAGDFFRLYRHWPDPPAPPRPRPTRPVLRVGFVLPCLALGGVEIWLRGMVSGLLPGFIWSGVAVTGSEVWNPGYLRLSGIRAIDSHCPVTIGADSVRLLAAVSDVLVVWGVQDFERYLPDDRPILIAASHGPGDWGRRRLAGAEGWLDHRVAVSESAATAFAREPVAVVWNGTDPARVAPKNGRAATRAAWGLSDAETAVLYLGRFSDEKRPLAVCEACAALGEGFRPVLVGSAVWQPGRWSSEARRIDPRVILPGPVDPPGDALAAADVLFFASPQEGCPLVAIEAWLAGVPVVCTRVGAVGEIERRFGRLTTSLTEPLDAPEMAAAVLEAVGTEGRERADRAASVAREHFTATAMRDRWGAFLRGVAGTGRPAG